MPLYLCEHLPRLQKISVHVEVEKKYEKLRNLRLVGVTLSLTFAVHTDHGCSPSGVEQVEIPLPWPNATKHLDQARIENIVPRKGALSINISCENQPSARNTDNFMRFSNANNVWSVKDLLNKTPCNQDGLNEFLFLCSSCDTTLLSSREYKFVDMPSEFWHEMMEFWHCHKPHEEHHHEHQKNYDGKILPRPGFVNIGSSYLQVIDLASHCTNCSCCLGELDGNILQIHKWKLKLAYDKKTENYPPYLFVYFALLDKINSSGTRKFALTTKDSSEQVVVWVTGVGLDVTFGGHLLTDCLKILYRRDDAGTEDILVVPSEVWSAFTAYLSEINALMPEMHRQVHMIEAEQEMHYKMAFLCSQTDHP